MPLTHRRVGHGPRTVIWLHGWFGSSTGWGDLPRMLDGEAFTHVFVDYRGYGARLDETGDYSLAEISADVQALADELGADTFALVGHSMGGAAIQRIFADAPGRVEALVGISPVGTAPTPFDDAARALFGGAAENPENRHAIVDLTTGNRLSPRWISTVVEDSLANSTPASVAGHLRAWSECDFTDEVRAAQEGRHVPVLVVAGEHDPALGPETVRATWVDLWPDTRLEVLPDAGHYGPEEAPVRLATLVESFLGGSGAPAAQAATPRQGTDRP